MQNALSISVPLIVSLYFGLSLTAQAEPVRNGNELALAWSATNASGRQAIQRQAVGLLHTFRYLRVTSIRKDQSGPGAITLLTVEPSSDLEIALVITKPLSLELAKTLTTNDSVYANGRIKSMGLEAPNRLVVDPAVLKHKDRRSPKLSLELLHEVDPSAH
ncbi:MAG: hypothetical protein HYV36_06915 [Lentisphaerae bacterium]|nr:hypothetical protein [Lentisphaerota bacterium]